MTSRKIEINIIKTRTTGNPVLRSILHSINSYLLRNKGAISDYHLLKDIVERNIDALDEEINTGIPIPLYLGLMGTMCGIIVGVGIMFFVGFDNFIEGQGIEILMEGVALAMASSLVGLALTVINSGIYYKGAKAKAESLKNEFFTFIQIELMPVLSQNAASSIQTLQQNLLHFNETFSENVGKFDQFLEQIHTSFNSQLELIDKLNQMDLNQLATFNISVLKELRSSTQSFERFNIYLQQVNHFVDNAYKLNTSLTEQLTRTHDIKEVTKGIAANITLNQTLIEKLRAETNEIASRKELIAATVIDIDNTLQQGLKELEEHTRAKIESIKNITIKEEDLLEQLLKKDRGNLDELKKMGALKMSLEKMESSARDQSHKLEELSASLKSILSEFKSHKPVISLKIPKALRIMGYLGLTLGLTIGLGYCIYLCITWLPIFLERFLQLFQ